MSDGDNPAVSDHLRPTDADVPDGVYRVVGTTDGVTLLRGGDADGRRVVTGEVTTVPDATGFEAAENPAGNRSLGRTVAGVPQTLYWQLRTFASSLAANPLPTAVGVGFVLLGEFGESLVGIPGDVGGLLIFVGALCLAYVGSGQLDS